MSPVVATLAELVAVDSVNPEWGGPGESGVADLVERFFADSGLEVFRQESLPGRDNVFVRLPGRERSGGLVLEAHMDTVSAGGMDIPPFDPAVREGKLFGRGSCDTKAGLATMMHALRDLADSGEAPPRDVWLAATIDEEHAFRGVVSALEWFDGNGVSPGGAFIAEPTGLRVVRANKGVLRFRIETRGVAAHSSKPHLGRNAIVAMGRVIAKLETHHSSLASLDHPLLGPPTASIGLIEGGEQINFVPSRCTIAIDRRMLPSESSNEILAAYRGLLGDEAIVHPPDLDDAGMETPSDASVVTTMAEILSSMALDPSPVGVPFGCDATKFSRAGIPAIVFGPGSIDQAHAAVEFVPVDEVEKAFAILRRILLEYGR